MCGFLGLGQHAGVYGVGVDLLWEADCQAPSVWASGGCCHRWGVVILHEQPSVRDCGGCRGRHAPSDLHEHPAVPGQHERQPPYHQRQFHAVRHPGPGGFRLRRGLEVDNRAIERRPSIHPPQHPVLSSNPLRADLLRHWVGIRVDHRCDDSID